MSILKNRCYCIKKNNKTIAFIIVKKDFYTEGLMIDTDEVLCGYFYYYDELNCFKLGTLVSDTNGISLKPKVSLNSFRFDGIIETTEFELYNSILDEYCNPSLIDKDDSSYSVNLVTEIEQEKRISYLIRKGINNLNSSNRCLYNCIKNRRYGNLKEVIADASFDVEGLSLDDKEVLVELSEYLDILKPIKEKTKTKKMRKRRKNS